MKKTFFTTLCIIALTTYSSAQSIKFGLKAGVNFSNFTVLKLIQMP